MESITIVSCAYEDRLGNKVTATEKYGLSNFHVELYTEVIGLCAQLISATLKKKSCIITYKMGNHKFSSIKSNGSHGQHI
jgi:hypothetical protein